ncbi:MAG: hypothetical protein GY798_13745 [Hyphomicrobiales bacterium]|nr:hypothetical protein [Hyphomicrobiales bacterium]
MSTADTLHRSAIATLLPVATTRRGLVFEDRTLAPRAGIRGPGARGFLIGLGFDPLPPPNQAIRSSSGTVVAMLGASEALLLDLSATASLWSFGTGAPLAPGAYPVPRWEGTFWVTVKGTGSSAMFAMICGVDLRPQAFADLAVAQTIVAKSSAIVIRDDDVGEEGFHILGDISLGSYLMRQLLDAADSV